MADPVDTKFKPGNAAHQTTYKPEYCEQVIEVAEEGLSITAFAGRIRKSRQTVSNWQDTHPEFAEAVEIAKAVRVERLERGLIAGISAPKMQGHIFALKQADPEWGEKTRVEHSGPGGAPLPATSVAIFALPDNGRDPA